MFKHTSLSDNRVVWNTQFLIKFHIYGSPTFTIMDLNHDYVVNESLQSNPIHYIKSVYMMSQLITEMTGASMESTLDLIKKNFPHA